MSEAEKKQEAEQISFLDPEVQRCPFPAYKKLFAENDVRREPATGFIDLLGYDHLRAVALNPKGFSSEHSIYGDKSHSPASAAMVKKLTDRGFPPVPFLINADAPLHRKVRSLVDQSFRAQRIASIEQYITELTDSLIDAFADKGEVDFVSEFSTLLPLYVIADTIGVSRDRALDFKKWSDAEIEVHTPGLPDQRVEELTVDLLEMRLFFKEELDKAKANPGENILGDLASATIDGEPIEAPLAIALLVGILVAGNESTTSAIGSAMKVLCEKPEHQDILYADMKKIPDFVDEVLRMYPPLPCQFRRNTSDVELSGVEIPADSIINMRFGAGNRDGRRFSSPDEFDMSRENVKQHLAFGAGPHVCLGQALARAELRISFERLLSRLKNFKLAGEPKITANYIAYGPASLPIAFDKR